MKLAACRRPGHQRVALGSDGVEAPAQASTVGGSTTAASPATSGRAPPVARDHRRAERHRLQNRSAEALVLRGKDERLGECDEPVAVRRRHPSRSHDPIGQGVVGDRCRQRLLGGTGAAQQDEGEIGIGPRPGEQFDEQAVVLVRMGDRRIDDHAPPTEAVAPAQLAGVGQRLRGGGS